MAVTSPDNIWSPDSGDDYALTVDLAAMADTVQDAITANRGYRVGTNSERLAISGSGLFEGLKFWATDTRTEWLYSNGSWVSQDTGWIAAPLVNGWVDAAAGEELEYRRISGVVHLKGRVALGTSSTIFTLPAGFRPKSVSRFIVPTTATAAGPLLTFVSPNGVVTSTVGQQPNFAPVSFPADG